MSKEAQRTIDEFSYKGIELGRHARRAAKRGYTSRPEWQRTYTEVLAKLATLYDSTRNSANFLHAQELACIHANLTMMLFDAEPES